MRFLDFASLRYFAPLALVPRLENQNFARGEMTY